MTVQDRKKYQTVLATLTSDDFKDALTKGFSISQLANESNIAHGTATSIVETLEKKGYLKKGQMVKDNVNKDGYFLYKNKNNFPLDENLPGDPKYYLGFIEELRQHQRETDEKGKKEIKKDKKYKILVSGKKQYKFKNYIDYNDWWLKVEESDYTSDCIYWQTPHDYWTFIMAHDDQKIVNKYSFRLGARGQL